MRNTLILAAITGLLMTSAANAQFFNSSATGTNIEGNVNITTNAQQVTQVGIGDNIHQNQLISSIAEGTSIKGDVTINTQLQQVTQVGIGDDIHQNQQIGSIGGAKSN
ncbi:MAG: hypothetical protein WDM91_00085 [Rhizomicrobium sp.]